MADEENTITIEMEPVSVPEEWITQPTLPAEEPTEEEPLDWSYLFPPAIELEPVGKVEAPYEHQLLINVETTDADPWNGRIVSISYLDMADPDLNIWVIIEDNEERMLNEFLDWFDGQNFTKLVGFKVAFDHRFLFAKAMLYRRKASRWASIAQRDIKQILDQVKETFVYFPSKTGTLDDWGKHLLGYGKLGPQEDFLKAYLAGDTSYVIEFSKRQVLLTFELYDLMRFVLGEASRAIPSGTPTEGAGETSGFDASFDMFKQKKRCTNCLQENDLTAKNCIVCGISI